MYCFFIGDFIHFEQGQKLFYDIFFILFVLWGFALFFSIILPGTKNIRMGIAFMNGKMKMGVFKYYWQTYSTKSILIILVFIASFLWGMISQSYQNPLVISSPNLTWMDYFFHNTKQAFLTILLGFVTYGFGSLALGAISGISAGVGIEITLQNNMGESIITAFLPHAIFEIPAI
ncbi:stage II sporulation protein M [Paenibacillus larvae]|uniref:stage II sporulation protein M n=1 Tax=Paenibacillus larvae TaxID=1464 RepID=UPI00288D7384|nr:stage II sporulation protein M [Paenibacillus larvae]MDT2192339.1 stage II sporulation protein M [Paenibacillus larvae]MDT2256978.1 stage II sporulation protein M [Paenibacillus larvae]